MHLLPRLDRIRTNEAIRVFGTVKAVLDSKKEGKPSKKLDLPVMVGGTGERSNFFNDLELIISAEKIDGKE